MKFREAESKCHVRGYIARDAAPDNKFWKNHSVPLECRVSIQDQLEKDWNHYDPEGIETSIVG